MDTSTIDFKSLALLEKAPSRKYIRKLIEDTFLLRNKFTSFNNYLKTPVFQNNIPELGIDEEQNHALILNLLKLINACTSKKDSQNIFPQEFNEQLKTYILETITKEIDANWGDLISKEIAESSTFVGIDWRLDVQVSTDSEKKTSNPIAFIDIESHDSDANKLKTTTYQLNKQELLNLYDNFNKIKEQINLLVSE